jgi:membrane-bound metal-dependent hydrolase YbcI (DUF457 family)
MNTPAHLIFGAAAFARPDKPKVTAAAIAGSLMPDLSLYFMSAWSLFIIGNSPSYVFDTQYFSDEWQSIFAIDNSFFLWGLILMIGLWMKRDWLWAFAGSGLLHISFDFVLHNDDARQHFWPISDWLFFSPFSYWDRDHHGVLIGGMEAAIVLVLGLVLIRRFGWSKMSILFGIVTLLELAPVLMFSGM